MRAVLYSQDKTFREVYSSFIYLKRKLAQYSVVEQPTSIDDYILADKLREDYSELTFFDSLHAAAALRRNETLVTNDSVYRRCEVATITFGDLARAL
jgi:predicted nucleic acid-binding protein